MRTVEKDSTPTNYKHTKTRTLKGSLRAVCCDDVMVEDTDLTVDADEHDHEEEEDRPHLRSWHLRNSLRVGDERQSWS